jgi:serine/threonine-protein kinase
MTDPLARLNAALSGRYAIERELGEGGMATVFLARDLKHNRRVALKVLKPELAAVVGAERFLAEIQTTANLQHPHILPLFDSGEADKLLFYVMPYVEGETLADRIERDKQLPVDEALAIATVVAGALQHAHERGVIHRDIKPANILLQGGQPVVSDFGIALAVRVGGGNRLTETGLSVGTPYYMSPEQATGDQQVGPPSDTYALACVLYEMLTGEPPYTGTTAQAVLGKIIQGVPVSATAVRRSVPANVDAAIRRALEKLPADRFTSAQSFAKALADQSFRHGADVGGSGGASVRLRRVAIAGWATAAAAVAGLVAGWAIGRPEPVRRVERFASPFLAGQEHVGFTGNVGSDLSPDGSMLVYRFDAPEGQILMVRRWDALTATPVRETDLAVAPAVSFDGRELAFAQGDEVKVLAFSGGPVRTLVEGEQPEWGPDGYVYATVDSGSVRVPSTGGATEMVSRLAEGETAHFVRDVLPDGRRVLLEVTRNGPSQIWGLDLVSGEATRVTDGQLPRYATSGHLLYYLEGALMAARFDPRRMQLLGTPVVVVEGISYFSLADDGKLYYVGGDRTSVRGPTMQLMWVTRAGEASAVDPAWTFFRGDGDQGWSISPDGSRVAVREYAQNRHDIWVKRLDTGPRSRLTFDDAGKRNPMWDPIGTNVTYLSNRGGNYDIWSQPADGTGEASLLLDLDDSIVEFRWSPDGVWLVAETSAFDIVGYRPREGGEPISLLTESYGEFEPALSPDGRWIAYTSNETGRNEVYVRPFPNADAGRWQVSNAGGRLPRWAHDGGELFFQTSREDGAMWVVAVQSASTFEFSNPVLLFESPGAWAGSASTGNSYELAPDDQRFLIARFVDEVDDDAAAASGVVLVNNFFGELERLVPE